MGNSFVVRGSPDAVDSLGDLALLGASAIWGLGISQTFRFFMRVGEEPPRFVILVSWLCFADTLREAFTMYSETTLYFNTIVYFSQGSVWKAGHIMPYLLSAFVAITAQSFFTFRIWILSDKRWFIPIIAVPVIFFQLCIPPVYFNALSSDTVTELTQKRLLIASLAVGAIVDVSLSAGLCILLWKNYVREGPVLKSTRLLLQRTILFSINTGIWTALSACLTIVVFLRTQTSDYMVFSYFHIMSPIYFATVLANLNARSYLRTQSDPSLPSDIFGSTSNSGIQNPGRVPQIRNLRILDGEIGLLGGDVLSNVPHAGSLFRMMQEKSGGLSSPNTSGSQVEEVRANMAVQPSE